MKLDYNNIYELYWLIEIMYPPSQAHQRKERKIQWQTFYHLLLGKSPTICLRQSYYLCITVPQESRNRPNGWFANGLLVYIWKCILKYILWILSKNIYSWQVSLSQSSPTAFAVVQGIFDLLSATLTVWSSLLSYFSASIPKLLQNFVLLTVLGNWFSLGS